MGARDIASLDPPQLVVARDAPPGRAARDRRLACLKPRRRRVAIVYRLLHARTTSSTSYRRRTWDGHCWPAAGSASRWEQSSSRFRWSGKVSHRRTRYTCCLRWSPHGAGSPLPGRWSGCKARGPALCPEPRPGCRLGRREEITAPPHLPW